MIVAPVRHVLPAPRRCAAAQRHICKATAKVSRAPKTRDAEPSTSGGGGVPSWDFHGPSVYSSILADARMEEAVAER